MAIKPTPLMTRLLARVEKDSNGCWIFTGALREGYGILGRGGRKEGLVYAHRATYTHFVGEIPKGLHIDHLCRVRACCNPKHLEPVTQAENNLRMWKANPRTHCKHGHEYKTGSFYQRAKQRQCKECHKKWNKKLTPEGEK